MSPPLRVAVLADPVVQHLGGHAAGRGDGQASTWLPHLVEALMTRDDLELTWISLRRKRRRPEEFRIGRHVFLELPQPAVTHDVLVGYLQSRFRLIKAIRRINPDVVHAWGTERPYPSVLGAVSQPTLLSLNGVLGKLARSGALPDGWRWKMQARLEKKWLSTASIISAESVWACNAVLLDHPHLQTRELVYGVHPSFYDIQWNPDPSQPVIFFAGTICTGKGLRPLVEAFARCSKRGWICRIAGDGPLRAELEKLHVPGIEWLGLLDWKNLQQQLSTAWCLVLPTLADSQPNVVKEARVVGLPVITTRHGGQAEYLRHGENATILTEPTVEALADAITNLLEKDLASVRLAGAIGHAEDRERFRVEKTAREFAALYHQLANST